MIAGTRVAPRCQPLAAFGIEGTLTARARTIAVLGVPTQAGRGKFSAMAPSPHRVRKEPGDTIKPPRPCELGVEYPARG